jgi:hypothetical protein
MAIDFAIKLNSEQKLLSIGETESVRRSDRENKSLSISA